MCRARLGSATLRAMIRVDRQSVIRVDHPSGCKGEAQVVWFEAETTTFSPTDQVSGH
jgi:hypothetical protein